MTGVIQPNVVTRDGKAGVQTGELVLITDTALCGRLSYGELRTAGRGLADDRTFGCSDRRRVLLGRGASAAIFGGSRSQNWGEDCGEGLAEGGLKCPARSS
jgi:hypothetical protein